MSTLQVPFTADTLTAQYPGDTVVYSAAGVAELPSVSVTRLRPSGSGSELTVTTELAAEGLLITVTGGLDGARYRVDLGFASFEVRITTEGIVRSARLDKATQLPILDVVPITRGQVLIRQAEDSVIGIPRLKRVK